VGFVVPENRITFNVTFCCLSGYKYLVSASRDRFIHIFDAANNYCHLQTLADHSSSVVSVKLIPLMEGLLMISCSNDKVLSVEKYYLRRDNICGKFCLGRGFCCRKVLSVD